MAKRCLHPDHEVCHLTSDLMGVVAQHMDMLDTATTLQFRAAQKNAMQYLRPPLCKWLRELFDTDSVEDDIKQNADYLVDDDVLLNLLRSYSDDPVRRLRCMLYISVVKYSEHTGSIDVFLKLAKWCLAAAAVDGPSSSVQSDARLIAIVRMLYLAKTCMSQLYDTTTDAHEVKRLCYRFSVPFRPNLPKHAPVAHITLGHVYYSTSNGMDTTEPVLIYRLHENPSIRVVESGLPGDNGHFTPLDPRIRSAIDAVQSASERHVWNDMMQYRLITPRDRYAYTYYLLRHECIIGAPSETSRLHTVVCKNKENDEYHHIYHSRDYYYYVSWLGSEEASRRAIQLILDTERHMDNVMFISEANHAEEEGVKEDEEDEDDGGGVYDAV